jgi:hypothetical protein
MEFKSLLRTDPAYRQETYEYIKRCLPKNKLDVFCENVPLGFIEHSHYYNIFYVLINNVFKGYSFSTSKFNDHDAYIQFQNNIRNTGSDIKFTETCIDYKFKDNDYSLHCEFFLKYAI